MLVATAAVTHKPSIVVTMSLIYLILPVTSLKPVLRANNYHCLVFSSVQNL